MELTDYQVWLYSASIWLRLDHDNTQSFTKIGLNRAEQYYLRHHVSLDYAVSIVVNKQLSVNQLVRIPLAVEFDLVLRVDRIETGPREGEYIRFETMEVKELEEFLILHKALTASPLVSNELRRKDSVDFEKFFYPPGRYAFLARVDEE
jgi:hypothetical protein